MKEGWEYGTINDFCNVNYGTRVVRRNVTGDKYPVYGGGGETFRMDEYNREDCLVVARFAMSKQCTRIVKGKFFLNDSGLTVSPKESSGLDAKLLDRYLLASNDLIYSYGRGSAQINLNVDEFRNMPLSFPKSLSEQQRIVDYLDAAFAKIDALKANAEKALNEAKALFQASLKEMLEPKEGWEEKKLGEISEIIRGKRFVRKDIVDDGVPCIHYGDIYTYYGLSVTKTKGCIKPELAKKMRFAEKNDVVVVQAGENNWDIGVGVAYFGEEPAAVHDACFILKHKQNPMYISYYLRSYNYHWYLIDYVHEGKICSFLKPSLENAPIPLPPLPEQQRIVATLDSLKSKVDRLQANFEKISQECDALKQAILKQVFE